MGVERRAGSRGRARRGGTGRAPCCGGGHSDAAAAACRASQQLLVTSAPQVFLGFLLFRDPPPAAQRAIRVVAAVAAVFQARDQRLCVCARVRARVASGAAACGCEFGGAGGRGSRRSPQGVRQPVCTGALGRTPESLVHSQTRASIPAVPQRPVLHSSPAALLNQCVSLLHSSPAALLKQRTNSLHPCCAAAPGALLLPRNLLGLRSGGPVLLLRVGGLLDRVGGWVYSLQRCRRSCRGCLPACPARCPHLVATSRSLFYSFVPRCLLLSCQPPGSRGGTSAQRRHERAAAAVARRHAFFRAACGGREPVCLRVRPLRWGGKLIGSPPRQGPPAACRRSRATLLLAAPRHPPSVLPSRFPTHPLPAATSEEVERMAGQCAICWGDMPVPSGGAGGSAGSSVATAGGAAETVPPAQAAAAGPGAPVAADVHTPPPPPPPRAGSPSGAAGCMALPCGHAYHRECLQQWLQQCYGQARSATCPMCQVRACCVCGSMLHGVSINQLHLGSIGSCAESAVRAWLLRSAHHAAATHWVPPCPATRSLWQASIALRVRYRMPWQRPLLPAGAAEGEGAAGGGGAAAAEGIPGLAALAQQLQVRPLHVWGDQAGIVLLRSVHVACPLHLCQIVALTPTPHPTGGLPGPLRTHAGRGAAGRRPGLAAGGRRHPAAAAGGARAAAVVA